MTNRCSKCFLFHDSDVDLLFLVTPFPVPPFVCLWNPPFRNLWRCGMKSACSTWTMSLSRMRPVTSWLWHWKSRSAPVSKVMSHWRHYLRLGYRQISRKWQISLSHFDHFWYLARLTHNVHSMRTQHTAYMYSAAWRITLTWHAIHSTAQHLCEHAHAAHSTSTSIRAKSTSRTACRGHSILRSAAEISAHTQRRAAYLTACSAQCMHTNIRHKAHSASNAHTQTHHAYSIQHSIAGTTARTHTHTPYRKRHTQNIAKHTPTAHTAHSTAHTAHRRFRLQHRSHSHFIVHPFYLQHSYGWLNVWFYYLNVARCCLLWVFWNYW